MTDRKVQDNYRVSYITVNGEEINSFFIRVDTKNELMLDAAREFQKIIYEAKGYWLEIVDASVTREGKCVDIRLVEETHADGIILFVENGNFVVETEFPNKAREVISAFLSKNVTTLVNRGVDFGKSFSYTTPVRIVYYNDFTVMENGRRNDFATIKACHDYANLWGHDVRAESGGYYVIGDTNNSFVSVKTNVDWGNATFYIDDKACTKASKGNHIFVMQSSYKNWSVYFDENSDIVKSIAHGFKRDEITNIGFAPGYEALLIVEDDNTYAYNRFGVNGSKTPPPMKEITRVDAEGNIVSGSEFLFDFPSITGVTVYRADDKPITLSGGTFITDANAAPPVYDSWARGLYANRSNVTVKNVVHKIINEGDTGAPYSGFLAFKGVCDVTYDNITLQGHKTYQDYNEDGTIKSNMGTYDISGSYSDNIVFKDCKQTNFYKDKENDTIYVNTDFWGIMGSNYTKNLTYDGCLLSRLDAHSGVYNVTIKNSTLGWIQLIGGGTAYLENVTCYDSSAFITLRGDYGSTWDGDIIFKDCTYKAKAENTYLIKASWHNWSFYENHQCTFPNVTVDNMTYATEGGIKYIYMMDAAVENVSSETVTINDITEPNKNIYNVAVKATIKNNLKGYNFGKSNNNFINGEVELIFQ